VQHHLGGKTIKEIAERTSREKFDALISCKNEIVFELLNRFAVVQVRFKKKEPIWRRK
jgi:hypothetical protein